MTDHCLPSATDYLARTGLAWKLLPFPQRLGPQAHSLVLLANGRRTLRELSALLGGDVMPVVRRLLDAGLLQLQAPPEEPPLAD
jgi:hypothetical protein